MSSFLLGPQPAPPEEQTEFRFVRLEYKDLGGTNRGFGHGWWRQITTAPLTNVEGWGRRYDFHKLVDNHGIDYIRAPLPWAASRR